MKRVQKENGNHESLLGLETHLRLKPQVIVYIYNSTNDYLKIDRLSVGSGNEQEGGF